MMNLIKADLFRLFKDKPTKIILIILAIMNLFTMGMFKVISMLGGSSDAALGGMISYMGEVSFYSLFSLSNLGLLTAVAISMFVGRDFSQNTIRCKIIGGNSRLKIYASTLIVNLIIGMLLYLLTIIEASLLGLAFYGVFSELGNCVKILLLCIPLYFAFIAVMTFVSLAVRTQTMGIVLNVLIVVLVPSLLSVVDMANATALNNNQVLNYLLSICPYQIINNMTAGMSVTSEGMFSIATVTGTLTVKTLVNSVILFLLASGLGFWLFYRSDLK